MAIACNEAAPQQAGSAGALAPAAERRGVAARRRAGGGSTARRLLRRSLLVAAAVAGAASPGHAQLSDGGFVPALAPHSVQQAPLASAGYASWDGGAGAVARADFWFGRLGAAAALGLRDGGAAWRAHGSVAALAELATQGVGLRRPGLQLQAAVAAYESAAGTRWSAPLALGVLLNAPIPLPNRSHVQIHPSVSVRHVVLGSDDADGSSLALGLRAVFTDRAGVFTSWGVHGHVRLLSDGADRGPRWELALTRVLRREASHGR